MYEESKYFESAISMMPFSPQPLYIDLYNLGLVSYTTAVILHLKNPLTEFLLPVSISSSEKMFLCRDINNSLIKLGLEIAPWLLWASYTIKL